MAGIGLNRSGEGILSELARLEAIEDVPEELFVSDPVECLIDDGFWC